MASIFDFIFGAGMKVGAITKIPGDLGKVKTDFAADAAAIRHMATDEGGAMAAIRRLSQNPLLVSAALADQNISADITTVEVFLNDAQTIEGIVTTAEADFAALETDVTSAIG